MDTVTVQKIITETRKLPVWRHRETVPSGEPEPVGLHLILHSRLQLCPWLAIRDTNYKAPREGWQQELDMLRQRHLEGHLSRRTYEIGREGMSRLYSGELDLVLAITGRQTFYHWMEGMFKTLADPENFHVLYQPDPRDLVFRIEYTGPTAEAVDAFCLAALEQLDKIPI